MNLKTIVLIVLDGLGIGYDKDTNPFYVAKPENLINLGIEYPLTSLGASGINVGLPWGDVGNCEVGHLNLGAGKIIYQNYPLITMAIRDKSFFQNQALKQAFEFSKRNKAPINFIGTLSEGIAEAAQDHIEALISMSEDYGVDFKLHFFSDGKDSSPRSFLKLLNKFPKEKLATIIGRHYALDHKDNQSLVKRAYDCLVGDISETQNFEEVIKNFYEKDFNDDIIPPILVRKDKAVQNNEAIIFFNFREDNIRSLVEAFIDPSFNKFQKKNLENVFIVTMTEYSEKFNVPVAFPPQKITKPLSLVLSENNKSQLKISENTRYPLITLFFNGLNEAPYENEFRISVPVDFSLDPINHPELMSQIITDRIIESLENQSFDFILANYSNLDVLAHTGNFGACVKAIKILDNQIKKITEVALKNDAVVLITSDHGNIEELINLKTGEIDTEHNSNPVPFYLIGKDFYGRKFPNYKNLRNETLGFLSDVAPTILDLFNIPRPKEMTGKSLLLNLF
jgi:2,3-bisphosphoglycerate-independent phosphoglycerate mutase